MKTITFYSYKGGVGRSLALANIASRLAEFGKQVCLLDFDLEAPGLHYKFSNYLEAQGAMVNKGIVDYIYEFSNTGSLPGRIADFAVSFLRNQNTYITLIPAGDVKSSEYWKKLSSINWYDLLYENSSGLAFLLDLKEKIKNEYSPDYLLIDSRTGISETSGIALSLLADEVVVMAANNRENLDGAKRILKSVADPMNNITGNVPKTTFVLSRIPFTETPVDKSKEQNLIDKITREFGELIDKVNIIHSDRDLEEIEQIKIGYDKDSSVSQIARDYLLLFEKLTSEDFTEEDSKTFKKIKDAELLYQKAIVEPVLPLKIGIMNDAIELNNSNPDLYIYRGSVYYKMGKWDNVVENCDAAIYIDTKNLPAYLLKGRSLLKTGQYESAKRAFETILLFDKSRLRAQLGIGEVYAFQKDFHKAMTIYNDVIERDVENPIGYIKRAHLRILLEQYQAALDDIYQALTYDSENGEAYNTLAEINAHIKNKNEFYLNLERALKLEPVLVESSIRKNPVYKWFVDDKRYIRILEKYKISLTDEPE
jgi:MinD-like ATPase involved in chromosome partitioning or flagellar assembly